MQRAVQSVWITRDHCKAFVIDSRVICASVSLGKCLCFQLHHC